jgi:hypothetical protein
MNTRRPFDWKTSFSLIVEFLMKEKWSIMAQKVEPRAHIFTGHILKFDKKLPSSDLSLMYSSLFPSSSLRSGSDISRTIQFINTFVSPIAFV